MTEPSGKDARPQEPAVEAAPAGPLTAGAMLRAARERQGVHIAMLAAAIKVSPRKLDALEGDRYDELPDATFTRALAQTVCRALKIDVQPVLDKLPRSGPAPLGAVSAGLNTPFRERPGRVDFNTGAPPRPLVWAGVGLLVAAAAILLWPAQGLRWLQDRSAAVAAGPAPASAPAPSDAAAVPAPAASVADATNAASAADAAASGIALRPAVETVHSAPPTDLALAAPRGATLVASDQSWVEITDGGGQTLLSRIVLPGETVNVDGALPMRLKIGNARAVQLVFRGRAVELDSLSRDNVARVELK